MNKHRLSGLHVSALGESGLQMKWNSVCWNSFTELLIQFWGNLWAYTSVMLFMTVCLFTDLHHWLIYVFIWYILFHFRLHLPIFSIYCHHFYEFFCGKIYVFLIKYFNNLRVCAACHRTTRGCWMLKSFEPPVGCARLTKTPYIHSFDAPSCYLVFIQIHFWAFSKNMIFKSTPFSIQS